MLTELVIVGVLDISGTLTIDPGRALSKLLDAIETVADGVIELTALTLHKVTVGSQIAIDVVLTVDVAALDIMAAGMDVEIENS